MAEGDTAINAVLGAVATTVLSGAVPFAPLFGGALSGYLQGGDRNDGLRIGVISGLVSLVLSAILLGLVFLVFVLILAGGGASWASGVFWSFFFVMGFLFSAVYIVGLSTVGGWVGNYLKYETDIGD